jgi:hypothetical protein
MAYSTLTVIWFQAEYAFPIEPESLARIKAIDWNAGAKDEEY